MCVSKCGMQYLPTKYILRCPSDIKCMHIMQVQTLAPMHFLCITQVCCKILYSWQGN